MVIIAPTRTVLFELTLVFSGYFETSAAREFEAGLTEDDIYILTTTDDPFTDAYVYVDRNCIYKTYANNISICINIFIFLQ